MTRVVAQHAPNLFQIVGLVDEKDLTQALMGEDGTTYYLSRAWNHFVLYKRAVSGWGALASPDGITPGHVPTPGQR